jgi:hypothetical protein
LFLLVAVVAVVLLTVQPLAEVLAAVQLMVA